MKWKGITLLNRYFKSIN